MSTTKSGGFYVTTYCNHPHSKKTGKPIRHECRIIPPKALKAEMEGDYEEANRILSSVRPTYSRGTHG